MASAAQLDLFGLLRSPMIVRPVELDGHVVQGKAHETLRYGDRKTPWRHAEIELHRAADGLWMWSCSFGSETGGGGYKVGEKWGKFATCRDDALQFAVEELLQRLRDDKTSQIIKRWALALR